MSLTAHIEKVPLNGANLMINSGPVNEKLMPTFFFIKDGYKFNFNCL